MSQDTARKVVALAHDLGTDANPLVVNTTTEALLLNMLKELKAIRRGIEMIAGEILDPEEGI